MDLNQPSKYPPKCEIKMKNKEGKEKECGSNCKYNLKEGRYTDMCWRHYRLFKKEVPPLITLPTKKNYQILLKKMVKLLSEKWNNQVTKNQVKLFLELQDLKDKTKTQFMKEYLEGNLNEE